MPSRLNNRFRHTAPSNRRIHKLSLVSLSLIAVFLWANVYLLCYFAGLRRLGSLRCSLEGDGWQCGLTSSHSA